MSEDAELKGGRFGRVSPRASLGPTLRADGIRLARIHTAASGSGATPKRRRSSSGNYATLNNKDRYYMRTRSKLLFAGLTAALMLSMAVASASAGRLSVSNRNFRIVWNPLTLESTAGIATIRCPVTMEGSFHSATIRKTIGALVGHVTRAFVNRSACAGGTATIHGETLPWHTQYGGFEGTLPNITGIRLNLVGATFEVEDGTALCTTRTTAAQPGVGIARVGAGGVITGLRADETRTIPLSGEFLCAFAGEGTFAGTGTVTLLGASTSITVRLI
jgi:hypothetical protein